MEQAQISRHAAETLEALNVPHWVVGSCANIAYGEARFTQDIDIVAAFEPRHVDGVVAALPHPEDDLSGPANAWAAVRMARRWARWPGHLDARRAVVEAVEAPDRPPGPGVP